MLNSVSLQYQDRTIVPPEWQGDRYLALAGTDCRDDIGVGVKSLGRTSNGLTHIGKGTQLEPSDQSWRESTRDDEPAPVVVKAVHSGFVRSSLHLHHWSPAGSLNPGVESSLCRDLMTVRRVTGTPVNHVSVWLVERMTT
jgi:hypothetical protein